MTPFLAISALCALAYLPLSARPVSGMRSLIKMLAVGLLAVAAGLMDLPVGLVAGLTLCASGDWLLSRGTPATFKAAIAAFALGHLAYVGLFLTHPLADTAWLIRPPQVWIAAGVLVVTLIVANGLLRGAGTMKYPVLGYIPVLLGMAFAALGLANGGMAWVLPAAIAFVLSDLALGIETFVLAPGHAALRFTPYLIWPLYWGAQVGFLAAFT
ncbi:MAG: lysoplasmalogenase [Rhodobacteraceae bacterium]|nr:lysoplasmalogenase [Paracoccaceae bacterium]